MLRLHQILLLCFTVETLDHYISTAYVLKQVYTLVEVIGRTSEHLIKTFVRCYLLCGLIHTETSTHSGRHHWKWTSKQGIRIHELQPALKGLLARQKDESDRFSYAESRTMQKRFDFRTLSIRKETLLINTQTWEELLSALFYHSNIEPVLRIMVFAPWIRGVDDRLCTKGSLIP